MAGTMLRAVAVLLAAAAVSAQMPATLKTPGPPPDVVAVFVGQNNIAAVSASGAFTMQGVGGASQAASGDYLSHTCNNDGSFDGVWAESTYTSTGGVGQVTYVCEHGQVQGNTYTTSYMTTSTCPLTSLAGATNISMTEVTNSNLGALLNTPYCNPTINSTSSALVHANAAQAPAPGPGPAISMPSPGTTSVSNTNTNVGDATGGSDSAGRRLLRA